ncbi:MAG TPA: hypothetical protein VKE74_04920, partial [Gemmataceae bacterium]|nr:hypothetical protein [Gemmataceae bacterium]
MAEGRRLPGFGAVVAGLVLLASLVAVWWWQFRPKPEAPPDPSALGQLDVVCLGRIDGEHPLISLEPLLPGKVEWVIEEGKSVKAKADLLRLNDEAAKLRVKEAEAAVEGAKAEVDAAKQEAAAFPARKDAAAKSAEAAAARVKAAEELLKEREAQQSLMAITKAELAAFRAEVAQLQQLAAAEQVRAKELAASDPDLRVRAAAARVKAAEVALQQARNALRDCTLTAPTDGVVLRVQVSVGETVTPGGLQPAIVFRPSGALVVRAELDQEFLGRVRPGMQAT